MSEKCPVCKAECENGATACSVCGFAYKPKIDMAWPIPEDAKNWLETAVKPYRAQWEAKKQKTKSGELENTFIDQRDGKVYKTVKIGDQIWMAENLNYNAPGSVYYDNDPKNGEKYGRLYDWKTAWKACPHGWHLPSNEEWGKLFSYGDNTIGTIGRHLKARSGWKRISLISNGNGQDTYSFMALPGGVADSNGCFINAGYYGFWWVDSKDEILRRYPYYISIGYNSVFVNCNVDFSNHLFSVRCLQYGRFFDKKSNEMSSKLDELLISK
jgi:uncharacterized protein (TIGR02145 family)